MSDQKNNPYRLFWMLGAAVTLPAILMSGPLAGYLIGQYLLSKFLGPPAMVVPIGVILGFLGSAIQIYRLIKKIKAWDSKTP